MNESDDESKFKFKFQKKRRIGEKNNFYSKEQCDSESSARVIDEERNEILFIVEVEEPEAKMDLEGELRVALKEIKTLRKRESQLMQDKSLNEDTIVTLRVELEEAKRIHECLFEWLNEKDKNYERLEEEFSS